MKKKQKIKSKILFRYYKDLLETFQHVKNKELNYKNEIMEGLKERIILLERKLRFKFIKICYKCGSSSLKYRIKKEYIINICLECGYQNFIKIKRSK